MSAILGLNEVPGYNQHVVTLANGLYLHHSVHVTEKTYSIICCQKCLLEINCSYLSAPVNGKMEISAGQIIPGPDGFVFSFCSVLTFSCDPGYDLMISVKIIIKIFITIMNKTANVETVQLKCEQEGEQEEARGVWKGKLTSRAPTCQRK